MHGWGFAATQSTLSLRRGSRLRGEQLAFPAARGMARLLQGAGKAALAHPEPLAVAQDICFSLQREAHATKNSLYLTLIT